MKKGICLDFEVGPKWEYALIGAAVHNGSCNRCAQSRFMKVDARLFFFRDVKMRLCVVYTGVTGYVMQVCKCVNV